MTLVLRGSSHHSTKKQQREMNSIADMAKETGCDSKVVEDWKVVSYRLGDELATAVSDLIAEQLQHNQEGRTPTQVVEKSLLSDTAILEHMKRGSVFIHPFRAENLSTSSYDVTLGHFYFRESRPEPGLGIYNPYSAEMVKRVWGEPLHAEKASEWSKRTNTLLENVAPEDELIVLSPGETILAHTQEFIGGMHTVTTMMKARSSMGRNFIEVCKCAGWGDIGYTNRWTMEITNNSRFYSVPLVVGRRIAQIVFFDTQGTMQNRQYGTQTGGKYQPACSDPHSEPHSPHSRPQTSHTAQTAHSLHTASASCSSAFLSSSASSSLSSNSFLHPSFFTLLGHLERSWTPLSCLPRMFEDREVVVQK